MAESCPFDLQSSEEGGCPVNERLEEALRLFREGRSIMPVRRNKRPYLASWKALQERRATEDEIRAWWKMWPDAGVAVITGQISGIVVVDVDPRHGGDFSIVTAAAYTDRVAVTAHDGRHFWYLYPTDCDRVPGRVNVLPGIDIRGDGNYVVCPPSEIDPSGVDDCVVPYSWQSCGEPGELTDELRRIIFPGRNGDDHLVGNHPGNGKVEKTTPERLPERSPESPKGAVAAVSEDRLISEILRGSKEGSRNVELTRLAGYLAGKGVPKDITEELAILWNTRNEPRMAGDELFRTVSSAYQMEKRKENEAKSELELIHLTEFLSRYADQEVKWLVDQWVQDQGVGFVVADPGSYKTWMTFDLAVSIATGTKFLGKYPVNRTGPIFLFQQEDALPEIALRISHILAAHYGKLNIEDDFSDPNTFHCDLSIPLEELPIYIHPNRGFKLTSETCLDQLDSHLDRLKPVAVFLDPLYSLGPMERYMEQIAERMVEVKKLRDKHGCAIIFVAHTTKNKDGELHLERERLWGNQHLNAAQEFSWLIAKLAGQPKVYVQRRADKVAGAIPRLLLSFDIKSDRPPFCYNVEVKEESPSVPGDDEVRPDDIIISALSGNKARTINEIAKVTGLDSGLVTRALKRLVNDGLVSYVRGGRYKSVSCLEGTEEV